MVVIVDDDIEITLFREALKNIGIAIYFLTIRLTQDTATLSLPFYFYLLVTQSFCSSRMLRLIAILHLDLWHVI
jgi:hypothetical protein